MYYRPSLPNMPVSKNKVNRIRVSGEGKIAVQPNKAEITLGASTEDKQLEQAQKNNSTAISKIISALNKIGIQDKQIQTANYSIYPQYDYLEGKQIFRGYKVEHLLKISIDTIENTGLAIDTAVSNGANIVSGIQFTAKDLKQFEHKALSAAVINAYQKANTIASTLHVQLEKTPILVTENTYQQTPPIPQQSAAFVKGVSTTPIQPGTMDIISQITAEFLYY